MDKKKFNKLLDEPQSGYMSLLEKNEAVLRTGISLSIKDLRREQDNLNKMFFLNRFRFITNTMIELDPYAEVTDTMVEDFLIKLRGKISKREINFLFGGDIIQITILKNKETLDSFNMKMDVRGRDEFSKVQKFFEDKNVYLSIKLVETGSARKYLYEYLDKKLEKYVLQYKEIAIKEVRDFLQFHNDYALSKNRLKLIYPKLQLHDLSSEEAIKLLDQAPVNFIKFNNLESYFYFYKEEFPSFNRSNKQIIKEITIFDKKLTKISQ